MRRRLIIAGVVGILLVCAVAPFLLPKGPAPDAVTVEDLADESSLFVELDGVRVHYEDSGAGEPALMLIHGYGSETGSWRHATPALSQTRRAVALDRTGFGLTSRPLPGEWEGDTPYSIDAHADEVVALMDDLGIAKTVLVGHSQGAAVALLVAEKHPERVEGVVLVAPELDGKGAPSWLKPVMSTPQMRRLGPHLMDWGAALMGERALERAWHDPSAIPEERVATYVDGTQVEYWGVGMWEHSAAPFTYGLAGRAQALDVPVLIIAGDDDRVVGSEELRELGSALPDATYVEIEKCGHIPQEECPDEFAAAVQAFADGL